MNSGSQVMSISLSTSSVAGSTGSGYRLFWADSSRNGSRNAGRTVSRSWNTVLLSINAKSSSWRSSAWTMSTSRRVCIHRDTGSRRDRNFRYTRIYWLVV